MDPADEVQAIVSESGNSFHCRVVQALRSAGWQTLVSPYYMDASTNKARELDLVAEKHQVVGGTFGQPRQAVVSRLFIECKYITQPVVFWFDDKNRDATYEWLRKNASLPANNSYTEKHHYLSGEKAAKLFQGKTRSSPENEIVYRALNQSLNAMISLRGGAPMAPEIRERRLPVAAVIEMAVVICNNFEQFYRVEMGGSENPVRIDDPFQLEVDYAFVGRDGRQQREFFLLDFVSFEGLDQYLATVESDQDSMIQVRGWD